MRGGASIKTKFFNAFLMLGLAANIIVSALIMVYYFLYSGK